MEINVYLNFAFIYPPVIKIRRAIGLTYPKVCEIHFKLFLAFSYLH